MIEKLPIKYFVILVISLFSSTLYAEIILDGTLGPDVSLEGPKYDIRADLGQQHGTNLFHSFAQFNINTGESATFSGPNYINNIINRVTGGNPSNIDGVISSTIPDADVYLINPAGIIFSSNATLNVQGSFHASTADTLHFQDGIEFNARHPEVQSLLSVAPISTFNFLTDYPQPLTINGSQLSTSPDKTLSFIGGNIKVTDEAKLKAASGRINMVSVAGQSDITLLPQGLELSGRAGALTLQDSKVTVSDFVDNELIANGGGSIYIYGGQFQVDKTTVESNTLGSAGGEDINVQANELIISQGSLLNYSKGLGQGGNIKIKAVGLTQLSNHSTIYVDPWGDGKGGNVELETNTLNIGYGSNIKASSHQGGDGGKITIRAREVNLSKNSYIQAGSFNSGDSGNIELAVGNIHIKDGATIKTTTQGSGKGGNINIQATQLSLSNGAEIASDTIASDTNETGKGGRIKITADDITLSEKSLMTATATGMGDGGEIVLETNQLILRGGSEISGASNGIGQGGNIKIQVRDLVKLEGVNSEGKGSNIAVNAQGKIPKAGNAGTLTLKAGRLQLFDGAQVATSTLGPGNASTLDIQVKKEAIFSGQDQQNYRSGLFTSSQSTADNAGEGGYINFTVGDLYLTDKAQIYARTWGSGQGGNIDINAQTINLASDGLITAHSKAKGDAGQIRLTIRDRLQMHGSQIETSAESADGGDLAITASNYIHLVNSQITTSVNDKSGGGGNIHLDPEFIILDGSEIIAKAKRGKGGNIDITTTGIYNFSGEPIKQVINASSKFNQDGIVTINTPDNNGEEGLIVLPSNFVDASALLDTPCSHRIAENMSSFMMVPTEGITNAPNDLLSNPALLLKPSPLNTVVATKKPETTAAAKPSMVALTTACHPKISTTQKPQTRKKSYLISEQLF